MQWLQQTYRLSPFRNLALRPTGHFPRQGRYEQVENIWKCIYQHRADVRKPLLYVYGTGGAGKTTMLKYIAERSDEDMANLVVQLPNGEEDSTLADWARAVKVMGVSFNDMTRITALDEELLQRGLSLAPVVVRLLFHQQSQETSFENFCCQLRKACDQNFGLKLNDLADFFNSMQQRASGSGPYVVLLVDELDKIPPAYVDDVRSSMCHAMTNQPLFVVFSSQSVALIEAENTPLGSKRWIGSFALPLLTTHEATNMIAAKLSSTRFSERAQERVAHLLALLSGGHARTIEHVARHAASPAAVASINDIVERVRSSIVAEYTQVLGSFPWQLLVRVLARTSVPLRDVIPDGCNLTYDDAVKLGFLIGGSTDRFIRPMISEVQVRALCRNFEHCFGAYTIENTVLVRARAMLESVSNFHGKVLESFHLNWEIVSRNCIQLADVHKHMSLLTYYNCGTPANTLGLGFAKGPLFDPANVPSLVLGQGLMRQESFVTFDKQPLQYSEDTVVLEFPPSFATCSADSRYLGVVWKSTQNNYPAIDFVIIVQLHMWSTTALNWVERTVALVFQSSNSNDDATTACAHALDVPDVQQLYNGAKRIMNHAGWEDDQFIFVVRAHRDLTDDLRANPPGENVMILTKESMRQMYGCFGNTFASLLVQRDWSLAEAVI